jgi:hypothetical protein
MVFTKRTKAFASAFEQFAHSGLSLPYDHTYLATRKPTPVMQDQTHSIIEWQLCKNLSYKLLL